MAAHGFAKGSMTLIDTRPGRARSTGPWAPGVEMSGGSAANTMTGVASLRRPGRLRRARSPTTSSARCSPTTCGRSAWSSRRARQPSGVPTGRSPDPGHPRRPAHHEHLPRRVRAARRPTTSTRPGGRAAGSPTSRATCGTGPRPWRPTARPAAIAHAAGGKVSLTLSDSFCVERHRDAFLDLVADEVDILFANEAEITALYQVAHVRRRPAGRCGATARWPRSPAAREGSVVVVGDEVGRGAAAPGRARGRHHRRRRPLRRRASCSATPTATTR